MGRKILLVEMCKMIEKMSQRQRVARVRKLALDSAEDAKFIKQYFPNLFEEAFPSPVRQQILGGTIEAKA
jgi:hypothetical protein